MKIYDCFMFFDEEMLLDLRLNIMDKYVDKFVITEATYMHSGRPKKLLFDINKYSKFKDKIIYLVLDKPFNLNNSPWKNQALQSDYILKNLDSADQEDYIMFSDPDEIPNPQILKSLNLKMKYGIFLQNMYCYKFNLFNHILIKFIRIAQAPDNT